MDLLTIKGAKEAYDVMAKAYCPYSKFHVGTALLDENDNVISVGCNVENIAFGSTICAERNAMLHAIAEYHDAGSNAAKPLSNVSKVIIVSDNDTYTWPCGSCRQVMDELLAPETPVLMLSSLEVGVMAESTVAKLNPLSSSLDVQTD